MVQNFPGQPPLIPPSSATQQSIAQVTGGGNTLTVNADGSLNTVAELPASTTMAQVVINLTANGDNTVVAGVASKTVKVYQLALGPASVAVNAIFKSGTASAISGTMALSTSQALVLNFSPYPWLITAGTQAFVVNLSTTASVGGFASVIQS